MTEIVKRKNPGNLSPSELPLINYLVSGKYLTASGGGSWGLKCAKCSGGFAKYLDITGQEHVPGPELVREGNRYCIDCIDIIEEM